MTEKGRVFVCQDMGFDYSDAESHFGELNYLLDKSEANVFNMPRVVALLRKRLWDANFGLPNDYLLAVGAPSIMMAAGIMAYDLAGELNVLQWDRKEQRYYNTAIRRT